MYTKKHQRSMEIFRERRKKSQMSEKSITMQSICENTINKSSNIYQRCTWDILARSIYILVQKIKNASFPEIIQIKNQLMYLNIMTGKGLLCTFIMNAQISSTNKTFKYAFLTYLINCKFPEIGLLLLKRCVHNILYEYYRLGKHTLYGKSSLILIAHLTNYGVVDPILVVDIVNLLLAKPTHESVELAYIMLHLCGHQMRAMYSEEMDNIANKTYKEIKEQGIIFKLTYTIAHVINTNMYSKIGLPSVGRINNESSHILSLFTEDYIDPEEYLNHFIQKPSCEAETYRLYYDKFIKTENEETIYLLIYDINDGHQEETKANYDVGNISKNMEFIRHQIATLVMGNKSFDYNKSSRLLMQLKIEPGHEPALCRVFLDLCCEENKNKDDNHIKSLGHVTQIFCQLDEFLVNDLEKMFTSIYWTIHNFEFEKVTRVSKYFAHLFLTDTISWDILSIIKLDKAAVVSPRIYFLQNLIFEWVNYLGYDELATRIHSEFNVKALEGIFLGDNSREFFKSMELDGFVDIFKDAKKSYDSMKDYPQN